MRIRLKRVEKYWSIVEQLNALMVTGWSMIISKSDCYAEGAVFYSQPGRHLFQKYTVGIPKQHDFYPDEVIINKHL